MERAPDADDGVNRLCRSQLAWTLMLVRAVEEDGDRESEKRSAASAERRRRPLTLPALHIPGRADKSRDDPVYYVICKYGY